MMNNFVKKLLLTILGLMLLTTGLVVGLIAIIINNPDSAGWVIGGACIIYFLLLFLGVRYLQKSFSSPDKLTKKLMEIGKKAMASVVNIEGTALRINFNPVLRVTLKVNPSAGSAFDAKIETVFPIYKIPRVGDSIEVIYNPENPLEIIVVKT